MANRSYFRSADLSALLTLEQQFSAISRRLQQQLMLSMGGLLGALVLLAQGPGPLALLGLGSAGLSVALGLWSGRRYHYEREYLGLALHELTTGTSPSGV